MTIPTLAEFTDYLNYRTIHRPESTKPSARWNEEAPDKEEIVSFMVNFWREWSNINRELKPEMQYAKWLHQQPNYRAAVETAFRLRAKRRTRSTLEDVTSNDRGLKDAEHLMQRAKSDKELSSHSNFGFTAKYFLDDLWDNGVTWTDLNARALLEYFYTDHARQTLEQPNLMEKYVRAQNSIQEFMTALSEFQCADPQLAQALGKDIFECEIFGSRTRSTHRLLGHLKPPKWMSNPIKRRGAHIREQLLVYRYWQMHNRWGRFPSSVVRDLMYIDGIEHQYNERTIERMYADFTDEKKQKSALLHRDNKLQHKAISAPDQGS